MASERPFTTDDERGVCGVCPSTRLPGGAFDVHARPSAESRFAGGVRRTAAGVPVCVHPERVGLPPGAYASEGAVLPWLAPPPVELDAFAGWLRAALTAAPVAACPEVIERATAVLLAADPGADVAAVLREALG
jgi:hypothetical protein